MSINSLAAHNQNQPVSKTEYISNAKFVANFCT